MDHPVQNVRIMRKDYCTCGQRHQPPPEAVQKCPFEDRGVLLGVEHEARKRQHCDAHQDKEQTQFFVGLITKRTTSRRALTILGRKRNSRWNPS